MISDGRHPQNTQSRRQAKSQAQQRDVGFPFLQDSNVAGLSVKFAESDAGKCHQGRRAPRK